MDVDYPDIPFDQFKDKTEELYFHLVRAEYHARNAHNLLYLPYAPKRSFWYRTTLGRAQSILMKLWVQEMNRRNKNG